MLSFHLDSLKNMLVKMDTIENFLETEYITKYFLQEKLHLLEKFSCALRYCIMCHFIERIYQLEEEVTRLQRTIKAEKQERIEDAKRCEEKDNKKVLPPKALSFIGKKPFCLLS